MCIRDRCSLVFLDRHRPNVADASLVQVARSAVVYCVLPAPVAVGCECHQTRYEADGVISIFRLKKGAVSTVVKDDKNTH